MQHNSSINLAFRRARIGGNQKRSVSISEARAPRNRKYKILIKQLYGKPIRSAIRTNLDNHPIESIAWADYQY